MASATLRADEWTALGGAVVLHGLLVALLIFQPKREPQLPKPERMTVSLATEVGLEATAPDPVAEGRAAIAPTLSDDPMPAPVEQPVQPIVQPQPQPRPVVAPQPQPRPQPRTQSPPTRRSAPDPTPRRRPDTPSSSSPSVVSPPRQPPARSGGSRIGDDFLPGAGSSTNTTETRIPASQIGASAKASIIQAIVRQLKPKWDAPEGPDSELLVTVLSFNLNPDGSLAGRPTVVSQSGDNDTNRAQKALHAERAIRAVQLAAPFKDLPPEYYNAWKRINGARFDRNLSQ